MLMWCIDDDGWWLGGKVCEICGEVWWWKCWFWFCDVGDGKCECVGVVDVDDDDWFEFEI